MRAGAAGAQTSITIGGLLPATPTTDLPFGSRVPASDCPVDFDARSTETVLHHFFRVGAIAALDIFAAPERGGFADDAHELAVLLQTFLAAGPGVIFEDFSFVEKFHPSAILRLGLLRC